MVRVFGWLAFLARGDAAKTVAKTVELLVLRHVRSVRMRAVRRWPIRVFLIAEP
jgi:hypothetical protein